MNKVKKRLVGNANVRAIWTPLYVYKVVGRLFLKVFGRAKHFFE